MELNVIQNKEDLSIELSAVLYSKECIESSICHGLGKKYQESTLK